MLEVHAILHRQRCYENMIEKTGTLSDAYLYRMLTIYSLLKEKPLVRCYLSEVLYVQGGNR